VCFGNDGVGPLDYRVVLGSFLNRDSGILSLDNIPQQAEILGGHSGQSFHLDLFPDFQRIGAT